MTLRFLHISDTHIGATPDYMLYGVNTLQRAQELVRFINTELPFAPDFVLHTGDLTYDPDPAATRLAYDVLSELNYPLYVVRGNHDDPASLRDYFTFLPSGGGRIDYDFTYNDFHFIVLDSFGREQPAGYLEDYQLKWLKERLDYSSAKSVVLVVHHIPVKTGNIWLDERMRIMNSEDFFDMLAPHQAHIRGLFFGHIHDFSTHYHRGILCSSTSASFSQFIYPNHANMRFAVTEPGGFSLVTLKHEGSATILHHQLTGGQIFGD